MNILAFGASSSSTSINRKLALYAAEQITDAQIIAPDLNDFEMPIYSMDKEKASGIPQLASDFKNQIASADAVIISFAEHNGSFSAAFKNILDWASRLEGKVWLNKPMLLLATSPGGRGGQTVLKHAVTYFPFMGGDIIADFSLPSFNQNFSDHEGITNPDLKADFDKALSLLTEKLNS